VQVTSVKNGTAPGQPGWGGRMGMKDGVGESAMNPVFWGRGNFSGENGGRQIACRDLKGSRG